MMEHTGFQQLANELEVSSDPSNDWAPSNDSPAHYQITIPQEWRQGRTAYGGLTAGLGLAVARKIYPDLPPLRSASVNFIGPVGPDPVFTATLLRKGRNVTSIQVNTHSDGGIVATNTLIFGAARQSHLTVALPAPETTLLSDTPDFTPPEARSAVPIFFHNFDTRLIEGGRPMSGAKDGYIRVWSRHKDDLSREGEASFLTLGDVLPPAALPMFTKMGPISSVNWMINIINDPITEDGWWHVESKLTAARDGYSSQIMRYWNTDGLLVAEGIQTVAIFV